MESKNDPAPSVNKRYALVAGTASIMTVAALITMKSYAYIASGSVSILASLTDSLMDAAIAVISFLSIRYSLKPADHEHRYGHGKIEGLAALFQAAFIAAGGVFVVFESLRHLARPEPMMESWLAIFVMVCSVVFSLALVLVQRLSLKRAPSLAVEADRANFSGDIATGLGVLAVLAALRLGAPLWIDPAFAIVLAAYLGYTARGIAMKGVDMLLDRELPDAQREKILAVIYRHTEILGVHDLRTRKAGMDVHISFDIELDPDQSLKKAHETVIALEAELLTLFPNAEIMIHKDPAGIPHVDNRHQVSGVHT